MFCIDCGDAVKSLTKVVVERNGVPYINEYVHIYTWENQKIVYMEAFYNGAAADAYRKLARGD